MGSEEILERPYIAAMNGDWNGMVDFYKNNARYLVAPVTFTSDTGLHLAVHSNTEKPLKDLLEIMEGIESFLPNSKNKFGNTVLHEATIYGNYEAAGLLVRLCPDLLMEKNNDGETPLFTAASFGEAEIVKFLFRSEPERRVNGKSSLLEIHHQRGDGLSILSAAIIRQHFETALLLLDLDGSLHSVEDKKGRTALQYLADMPSAFESGVSMGICERLINCCLPVKRHHKLKSQVETRFKERKEQGDVESGQGRDSEDLESGSEWNQRGGIFKYLKVPKGCWLEGFWNQKTKHVFALKLAKLLIKKDESLNKVSITITDEEQGLGGKENEKGENKCTEITIKVKDTAGSSETNSSILTSKEHIPLFIATRNGIEVIVREILDRYPYAVEQLNEKGQSILHVAVMHRQEKIFSLVKQRKIPMARLHRVPDREGNTLLHHVAHMEHYRGGTRPGAALQLQEELQWYEVSPIHPCLYLLIKIIHGLASSKGNSFSLCNASEQDRQDSRRSLQSESQGTTGKCTKMDQGNDSVLFHSSCRSVCYCLRCCVYCAWRF
uniref:Uncharacterized protein n=1 Tax=Salix viminalis TaxID=40686 RepID=A0A6N2NKM8_SALVM